MDGRGHGNCAMKMAKIRCNGRSSAHMRAGRLLKRRSTMYLCKLARVGQEHMCACAVYNNVHAPRPLSLRMFPRTGTTRLVTSNCHAPSGMQALQLPLSLSFHSCYKRARDFLTWSRCGLKLMHTHTDINIPTTAFN